jgi:hypothetical protein
LHGCGVSGEDYRRGCRKGIRRGTSVLHGNAARQTVGLHFCERPAMGSPGGAQGDLRSRRGRGHETRAQRDLDSGLGGGVMRPPPSAVTPASASPDFSSGVVRPARSAVAWSHPQDRQGSYKAPRLIGNAAVSRLRAIFITDYKAKYYAIHRCSDYSSAYSKPFVHKKIRLEPARVGLFRLFQRQDITQFPV